MSRLTDAPRRYGIRNCPEPVRRQVRRFVSGLLKILGSDLVGVYLHGSLAMGCFNPRTSDIDLLVVTRKQLGITTKHRLATLALRATSKPSPIEVTSFSRRGLRPWRYPTPFNFHFSEDWRSAYESGTALRRMPKAGEDFAAQLTEARARGVVLFGSPIETALPVVPRDDCVDSILRDLRWAMSKLNDRSAVERRTRMGIYLVLNACRVLGLLETDRVLSKAEGARWALMSMPERHRSTIRQALRAYEDRRKDRAVDVRAARAVAARVIRESKRPTLPTSDR